jgi:alkylation response protein AidB-like acyl-CoA dehydrogenase
MAIMNLAWTPSDQDFRDRVRAFLARELPPDWLRIARHGPGSAEQTAFSLQFCPRLAEAGLLVPHWPQDRGGGGGSVWQHVILGEEMWAAGEPRGPQYMNVNWIGPVLMRFGTPEQQARFLPPIAAGRAIWCQGFSEPGAGSDLASLRTRAVRDGDDYVITGQKIWTSYAKLAQTCFLLARVGAEGEGKSAIAIFLVPMDTPGIEVRAIPSLIGHGDIHEVFLTEVRVPATARLGAEGQGWAIVSAALADERTGIPRYALAERALDRMVALLSAQGRFADPAVRQRAAAAAAACQAARLLVYAVADGKARGLPPDGQTSVARLAVIAADHAVSDLGLELLPEAYAGPGDPLLLAHHERAIVTGIAAGAAEIQLNLVAQRRLGLPKAR